VGACTLCGNGNLEPGEICDSAIDPFCSNTCTDCNLPYVFSSVTGICGLCGNGFLDPGEICDSVLSTHCDGFCACVATWVSDGSGGCTQCGNGLVDPNEYCDALSPNCATDCSACAPNYVSVPNSHECTLCGNGVVDAGEVCDASDPNCSPDCEACVAFEAPDASGHCTRCGNGYLDDGEQCDTASRTGCNDDCGGCGVGLVPNQDKYGTCGSCGNSVVEPDEACDSALDSNCYQDCSGCVHPYIARNRHCVLCGNGFRDSVFDADGKLISTEVCDAAQFGCTPDCGGCQAGFVPAGDATGNCIPECTECCQELATRNGIVSLNSVSGLAVSVVSLFLVGLCALLTK